MMNTLLARVMHADTLASEGPGDKLLAQYIIATNTFWVLLGRRRDGYWVGH